MWNGTTWTLVPTPKFAHAGAMLNGVSCTPGTGGAPARCMAVGSEGGPKHPTQFTLAESWNGRSWKFVGTPIPLTPGGTALNGVSCTGGTACMAAGYHGDSNGFGTSASLAERWNGKTWRRLVTPTPDSSATFTGVACPEATDCEAVGTHAEHSPTLGSGTFAAIWPACRRQHAGPDRRSGHAGRDVERQRVAGGADAEPVTGQAASAASAARKPARCQILRARPSRKPTSAKAAMDLREAHCLVASRCGLMAAVSLAILGSRPTAW
jgi:hypothetical protein